jgi:predicted flap endonuclease-1-like 5' DNA nuclease
MMEQAIPEPALWSFLLQVVAFMFYVPTSYLAYRWVRAPLKHRRVKESLSQLGITLTEELDEAMAGEYRLRHYVWPLLSCCVGMFVTFAWSHPYTVRLGFSAGLYEDVINIFDADDLFPRLILAGRFVFWGWLGAWTYAFHLTIRRFLAYDLTPSVYVFTLNRFLLAISVGTIVCTVIGAISTWTKVPFDVNMATVCVVAFFVGFFPEQGINWITATAQKTLKQQEGIVKEIRLSEIEGLSIWNQGRLKQEGIDNVQNLATANVSGLIIGTPFAVTQIIDWVDQAILLSHTSHVQFELLEKAGIIRATDVLASTENQGGLEELAEATDLSRSGLMVLSRGLQSAFNVRLVARFRWQSSLDAAKMEQATTLTGFQSTKPEARHEDGQAIVRDIEGIDESDAQKLKGAGISTTWVLLEKGGAPQGRREIAQETGIGEFLILRWVNRADLLRVEGVGREYASLLESAGVDTVLELARRNPQNLHRRLTEVNEESKLVRRLPTEAQVEAWVEQAKRLPRVINY